MHKGVILLVKTRSVKDANSAVADFLEEYGNGRVWDWYEIGGRWSGALRVKDGIYPRNFNLNVMRLSHCIHTVRGWVRDMEKEKEEFWKKMIESKTSDGHDMSGYYAGLYRDAVYGEFCFESNVYDITQRQGEIIPKNIKGYFAVMVDMHN